jgi:hypothetical protein
MKARFAASALALLVAMPAQAQPVYLLCPFATPIEITVDEAQSAVMFRNPTTGSARNYLANFGPQEVRFGDDLLAYVLDRTTLMMRRTIRMLRETDTTTCKLVPTPKRAF